jgi:acetyltransferase-like isoleucine patch superfamily enzyme
MDRQARADALGNSSKRKIFLRRLPGMLAASIVACVETFLTSLPNTRPFSLCRIWYWRWRHYDIASTCFIARNVYFLGKVSMRDGSSISNNSFLNGSTAGISIGRKVMIAPNCVLVAFDHSYQDLDTPMIDQPVVSAPIIIDDDVWIAANCTITKGVRLGRGCIVGANSVVTRDVEPFMLVGGVPARVIGNRTSAKPKQ